MSDTTQVLEPGDGDADQGSRSGGAQVLGIVFGAAGLALALLALVGVLYVGARVGDVDDDIDEMEHMHGEWMGQMGPGQMGPGKMDPGQMGPGHGKERPPGGAGEMPSGELMERFDDEDLGELSDEDRAALRKRLDAARERLDEFEQKLDDADTDAPDQTVATTAVPAG